MGRGFRQKRSPLAAEAKLLGDEFCSLVDSAPEEELRKMLAQLPLDRSNLQEQKKVDPDLSDAQQRMKSASQPYREGFKRIDTKAAWIRRRLVGMGKTVGDASEQEGKELPAESFDKLGGKKEDAIQGVATEAPPNQRQAKSKKAEAAVKTFQQNIEQAPKPADPTQPKN